MAKHSFLKGQLKLYERVSIDDRDKLIVITHWAFQKHDCFVSKDGQVRYVDSLVFIFFVLSIPYEEELIDWEQPIDWIKSGENGLCVNYIRQGFEFKVKFCMDQNLFAVKFDVSTSKMTFVNFLFFLISVRQEQAHVAVIFRTRRVLNTKKRDK